jgi:hypothetical protein
MDAEIPSKLVPGARVRVTQQIAARHYTWTTEVRGTIVEYSQRETGSWFAHGKDDKLWLDRLLIRKDDGELTTLILDEYTHLEMEGAAASAAVAEKKNEADLPV